MRISRERVSDIFFCFVLYLSTGAMEVFTGEGGISNSGGSPLMKVLWAGVYLAIIVSMLRHRREIMDLFAINKSFLALMLLAIFSVQWSIDPKTTIAKAIPLLLSALVGLEFARRYTTREQLRMLWIVLAIVMVLGVIVQLFMPGIIPASGDDEIAATAWRGIVATKNTWARLVVLTGVVILSRTRRTPAGFFQGAFLMMLVFALLAASRSTGGVVVMAAMTALFFVFGFLRWKRKKVVILVGTLVPGAFAVASFLVIENLTKILTMLGKDPTMTGRTIIWDLSLHFAYMRPLLGYGYAAFWSLDSRPARLVREAKHWDTLPHAHNGYIDLILALGFIGLALYVVANFVGALRAARYIRRTSGQESMWPLAYLCVVFIYQINEASIVSGNQITWILFSSVLFSVAIEQKSYRYTEKTVKATEKQVAVLAGV